MLDQPLADARGQPQTKMDVDPQADIVSGRERQLECQIKLQAREIAELKARMEEMEDHFGRQIAELRRDLNPGPQPKQKNRGEILIALLAATPHGKMLEAEARVKMDMTKPAFSALLRTLDDRVRSKPWDKDRRKKVLILED